jgi:hypothetical protein
MRRLALPKPLELKRDFDFRPAQERLALKNRGFANIARQQVQHDGRSRRHVVALAFQASRTRFAGSPIEPLGRYLTTDPLRSIQLCMAASETGQEHSISPTIPEIALLAGNLGDQHEDFVFQ